MPTPQPNTQTSTKPKPQNPKLEQETNIAALQAEAPPALERDSNFQLDSTPPSRNGKDTKKTELNATIQDWNTVLEAFKLTGNASKIAQRTGLPRDTVKAIITQGIPRLGLPAIYEYTVDAAEVNLDLRRARQERQTQLARQDVQAAVTERAITEAASAQQLLEQATQTGALLGTMVNRITQQLIEGTTTLEVPEQLTPQILETLAKVADANSRTMERAVKLVRLTAGEATELIEHKIAHLIANCTTEELAQASLTGSLPKRLMSRSGTSADPISNDGAHTEGNRSSIIDVDFTTNTPTWKQAVSYEGMLKDDNDTDEDKDEDE